MLYLDSSAVVKRYVAEPGSAQVAAAIRRDPEVTSSLLTSVEVRAALAAAARAGRLARPAVVVAAFRRDWTRFAVIGVDGPLAAAAGDLAEKYRLRGNDAVQLAAAVAAFRVAGSLSFGTFDATLRAAAVAEGLPQLF